MFYFLRLGKSALLKGCECERGTDEEIAVKSQAADNQAVDRQALAGIDAENYQAGDEKNAENKTANCKAAKKSKNDVLLYKKMRFFCPCELPKNIKESEFVVVSKRVILFANKDENNFNFALKRQKFAIFSNLFLLFAGIIACMWSDFCLFACVFLLFATIIFVLTCLNLLFLKQQIRALKIILSLI